MHGGYAYLVLISPADESLAIAMAAIMALVMYSSLSMLWLLHSCPQPDAKKGPEGPCVIAGLSGCFVAKDNLNACGILHAGSDASPVSGGGQLRVSW